MKSFVPLLLLFTVLSCTQAPATKAEKPVLLEITEIEPDKYTALTRQHMFHLAKIYDLTPFLYTKKVAVQSGAKPISHPVITIPTKHADSPHQILAIWLHEEFHWWANRHVKNVYAAMAEIKRLFPNLPASARKDKKTTYLHFIINFLEYETLVKLLGEKEALKVIAQTMKEDKHFPWVYRQVVANKSVIKTILEKHNLLPEPLR